MRSQRSAPRVTIELPDGVSKPHLTMFIDSGQQYPQGVASEMIEILKAIGWYKYTVTVDVNLDADKRRYLMSLMENPPYPHLFFHGKPIGSTEQVRRAYQSQHPVRGNYLMNLMRTYIEWASLTPRPVERGCESGFQLNLDLELLYRGKRGGDIDTPAKDCNDPPEFHDDKMSITKCITSILPRFPLLENVGFITFDQLIYDLLVNFSFLHVKTNGPESTSTVITASQTPKAARKTHRRCFRGTEIVSFLCQFYRLKEENCRELCQMLMDLLVIRQVERKEIQLFNNCQFLYRFTTHDNPLILNKIICFPRRSVSTRRSPMKILRWLYKELLTLYYDSRQPTVKLSFDLRHIYYNSKFMVWRINVCELQQIFSFDMSPRRPTCLLHPISPYDVLNEQNIRFLTSPCGTAAVLIDYDKENERPENYDGIRKKGSNGAIGEPLVFSTACSCNSGLNRDDAVIKSFFINLFNMGILHSFVQVGIPVNASLPSSFLSKVGYVIGMKEVHLVEIFCQILQLGRVRNSVSGGMLGEKATVCSVHWTNDQPHLAHYEVARTDPRIHFALQDGTKPVAMELFIKPETIETQLATLARDYVMSDDNFSVEGPEHLIQEFDLPRINCFKTTDGLPSPAKHTKQIGNKITIYLSALFEMYECDFGKDRLEVLYTISEWLTGEKRELLVKLLELHEGSRIQFGIKFRTFQWDPSKLGIINAGRFPFTEERRSTSCTERMEPGQVKSVDERILNKVDLIPAVEIPLNTAHS
eukprot:GHVH01012134.1.p1 GENE.GHVH01012134.1~~GHVH01012134.1.p1  ORF type:complete len:758 (+),score=72.33 GHVH01012134.1:240-2513(+)